MELKNEEQILKMTKIELQAFASSLQTQCAEHELAWAGGGSPDDYHLYVDQECEAKRIEEDIKDKIQKGKW